MASYAARTLLPGRTRRSRRGVAGPLAAVVLAGAALLAAGKGLGLLDLRNPFAAEEIDRSGPALMKALTDLQEFHGSSAEYQQVVEIEKDTPWVPSFVSGSSTTFLATGSVEGIVDFSSLSSSQVKIAEDGSVAITLPKAYLGPARLDASKSGILDRDRGVVDRAAGVFGDGTSDDPFWAAGQSKIAEAAAGDPAVLARAEANARATLTELARSLGYEQVTVTFVEDPAASRL